MPDAFHSGPRLRKVSKVAVTSKSPREVLTLGQVIRHAPCDINREDDGLIDLSGGHLLDQLNDVRDRGRNLADTCAVITAWLATGSPSKLMGRNETHLGWDHSTSSEDREGRFL